MARVNLAQRLRGSGLPRQAVLELNPRHPLIRRLNRQQDDAQLKEWATVLFNQAVLTLGARIEDPTAFVKRLNDLFHRAHRVPADAVPQLERAGRLSGE